MKNTLKISLTLALAAALMAGAGLSASTIAKVCKAEKALICKNVKPGAGAIFRCLKTNFSKVNSACKTEINKTVKSTCQTDSAKLCPKKGIFNLTKCMQANLSRLTKSCKILIPKKAAR